MSDGPQVRSYGAAMTVTGSCHLLDTGSTNVLVDCGAFQGSAALGALNHEPFGFDLAAIDAVLLTHAHMDHAARLPLLVKRGYSGPIYALPATKMLAEYLLLDGAKLQAEDAERIATYKSHIREVFARGASCYFVLPSVQDIEHTYARVEKGIQNYTFIRNAAMEPEIIWLADILNKSGAHISGAGTPIITVRGSKLLSQTKGAFRVIPDRIEAGSFIILGALAAKKLTVRGIIPEHLESLIELLEYTGTKLVRGKDYITISQSKTKTPKLLRPVSMRTHEYPGFPTDLQSPMMIYLTQIAGESFVFETIFEGRLNYTESLNRMGANITMMDPHRVLVKGASQLKGSVLESPDIRAGLAFVIAGAIASGTSEIHNVYHIDRGYEDIEKRLRGIGLDIIRAGE